LKREKGRSGESWMGVPPWILLSAVLILAPIFIFWASENIKRQKESTTLLLLEKGAALIRSFEAGARTGMMGMMGMRGTAFKLQRLLMETAQQPDIVYLIVTDEKGTVLAHSDPDQVGGGYGAALDLQGVLQSGELAWRRVPGPNSEPVFEVFKVFSPEAGFPRPKHRMMQRTAEQKELLRRYMEELARPRIIFVGLDMSPFEEARREEARHTVVMAVILLLMGFAGLLSIFLVQAYRTARRSLSRVQAFSDHVIENMPIGLAALDRDGTIVAFNHVAGVILGVQEAEALGRPGPEVLPPEMSTLTARTQGDSRSLEREISCTLADGRALPLELSLAPLENPEGEFIGGLILFRDLTEVQELKQEVERSRRLASIGRLAAGVAHEIRNPLSSIKGFATYFRERYREVEEDRKTAEIMIQEVDRLNRVIGQLLDFARPMSLEKRPAPVEALIRHALKMVEARAAEQGVAFELDMSPDVGELRVDMDRMVQVLLNLFINALEAMPGGGTLRVETAPVDRGERVRIRVEDTGTGISEGDLEHVFDPYFTTKSSGTGLGLAIAHKIVEGHEGEISVESRPGATSVSIILPK